MREAWMAGLAVVALAASPARSAEWAHKYSLAGKLDLHVKADDASVRIEIGTGSGVDARVTTVGWPIEAGGVTIQQSQTGDRVDITVRAPSGGLGFRTEQRSAAVVVRVPKQADLDIETGDGSIEVQPVSGRLKLSTGDGNITADGVQGEIRLRTGDGSVRAKGLSGRLQAVTGDGHLNIQGRFDVLDLATGDGGIEAAAEPGSRVEEAWSLRSGDGGITLRLPDGLGADLDVQTGDGRIVVDKPVTVTGTFLENSVRGKLGAGGLPLRIRTGDGSIRLQGR